MKPRKIRQRIDRRPRKTSRRVSLESRQTWLTQECESIRNFKRDFGFHGYRGISRVKTNCEYIYGGELSDDTWRYWLDRVLYAEDEADLENDGVLMSTEALLYSLAAILSKNTTGQGGKKQATRSQIANRARQRILNKGQHGPPKPSPKGESYEGMLELIIAQCGRCYSKRHLQRFGLFISKEFYSYQEALDVLNQAPNNYVGNHTQPALQGVAA